MKESRTRLFLVSPPMPDTSGFASMFEAAAAAGDVASLLIRTEGGEAETLDLIASVLPSGYDHNVAILVEGSAELAARSGADGVHLPGNLEAFHDARKLLGSDRIVGVLSGNTRHAAMEIAEAGADYVAFDQSVSFSIETADGTETFSPISWWGEMFEVPSVAFSPVDPDDIETAVREGADFIRPEDGMWSSADRAAETVRRYNAKIDEAI